MGENPDVPAYSGSLCNRAMGDNLKGRDYTGRSTGIMFEGVTSTFVK